MNRDPINRTIVRLLREGRLQREIAATLGIAPQSVEGRIARYHLTPERFGLTRLTALAAELDVSRQALYYRARAGDFEAVPWGNIQCVARDEATKVRQLFAHPKRATYVGWLNSAQTAQAVGISAEYLHRLATQGLAKLSGVRHVRAQGMGGFMLLFCPADVPELARRFGRRGLPRRCAGRLNTPQLADLAGVPDSRIKRWARAGAPYVTDQRGRYWFIPAEVRDWLASGVIRPPDLAAVLDRLDTATAPQAA